MKTLRGRIFFAGLCFAGLCFFVQSVSFAIDVNSVVQELKSGGATLEIHGIDSDADRLVGTYRSKTDFFDFKHFALESQDIGILAKLKSLKRHDEVLVKGSIPSMGRPFLHIAVSELTLTKPWGTDLGPYHREAKIPDAIKSLSEMIVKIHATTPTGRMLVVEYIDSILPVVIPKSLASVAANLGRGDLINLKFEIRNDPHWPIHIEAKDEPQAITSIETMIDHHGKPVALEGLLVLFPQSPQVQFNVFALQREIGNGLKREYTIVNFQDPTVFAAIRAKLQTAWDNSPAQPLNSRNKLVKSGLYVKATGIFNYVDKGQANPQILVADPKQIEIIEK